MAIFNSSLLFLLLITAFLAFIIGWLSRKLTSGESENVLKQKLAVLRNTIAEQKEELNDVNAAKAHVPAYSNSLTVDEPNEAEDLVELRLKYQKIVDNENDLKVKLSQLYAKKQAEINRLSSQIEGLKGRLDTIKDESTLENAEPELDVAVSLENDEPELDVVFPLNNGDSHLEIESQKQTIGRLENQLKIETDIYKRRIEELESKANNVVDTRSDDNDKLKALSDLLAEKDAELIAMQNEIKNAKVESKPRPRPAIQETSKKKAVKKKVAKKTTKKTAKKVQVKKKKVAVKKDDLTEINGIGPKLKALLYKNGVTSFAQVAAFKAADIKSLDDKLGNFHGRIKRDEWVKQAKKLAK